MSTNPHAIADTMTMFRRDAVHSIRNPMMTLSSVGTPLVMMLLFVGMFGSIMGKTLGASGTGYIGYLTPGVILMGLGSGVAATAVNLSVDKHEGVIARFRTMAISRMSVLTGQVLGAVLRSIVAVVLILGVAVALGFRSSAAPLHWLAALGLVALVATAMTWIGTAFGLLSSSPATANGMSIIALLLPLMSSGFVPPSQMPDAIRWFADNQPFTPLIETLRALITVGTFGDRWLAAVLWSVAIALGGYAWSRHLYNREQPAPSGPSVGQLMSH